MTGNKLGCDINNPSAYHKHLAKVTFSFLETLTSERSQYGFGIEVGQKGFEIHILHDGKIIYAYYPASYIFIDYVNGLKSKGYPNLIASLKEYFRKNKEDNRKKSDRHFKSISFLNNNNFNK